MSEATLVVAPRRSRASAIRWFVVRWMLILTGIYLLIVVMFAGFQRSLIYQPTREAVVHADETGLPAGRIVPVGVAIDDELTLNGWQILAKGRIAGGETEVNSQLVEERPVFLFFPGNGGHRGWRGDQFAFLSEFGEVFAFDYRGYGENAGSPSEANIAADARSIWKYLTESRQIDRRRVVLYGESLGGGVATRLAAELCYAGTPPAGLVLQSTFASLGDVASHHYPWLPVQLTLVDRYESIDCIREVTCPILQVHGIRDSIIPHSHGLRLFEQAPEKSASGIAKTFIDLPRADHNDVFITDRNRFQTALAEFLQSLNITGPAEDH